MDSPFFVFGVTFALLMLCVRLGVWLQHKRGILNDEINADLNIVRTLSLTMLGLIIGFSFSMAIPRYDARKGLEEAECRVIESAYLKADLMAAPDAARIKGLLLKYLSLRITFYGDLKQAQLEKLSDDTDKLQMDLWNAVRIPANAHESSETALAVSGIDTVISTRRDAEAAWHRRVPVGTWILLITIAGFACLLTGFGARLPKSRLHFLLPLLIAIAFYQIADIENPRVGFISVRPENLQALAKTLQQN